MVFLIRARNSHVTLGGGIPTLEYYTERSHDLRLSPGPQVSYLDNPTALLCRRNWHARKKTMKHLRSEGSQLAWP